MEVLNDLGSLKICVVMCRVGRTITMANCGGEMLALHGSTRDDVVVAGGGGGGDWGWWWWRRITWVVLITMARMAVGARTVRHTHMHSPDEVNEVRVPETDEDPHLL